MAERRFGVRARLAAIAVVAVVCGVSARGFAQVPPILPSPTPRPSSTPAPTSSPSPAPTATPRPSGDPGPSTPPGPPTPPIGASPSPSPSASPGVDRPFEPERETDHADARRIVPGIPPGAHVPILPRTAGRNTVKLVRLLERATLIGMTLDEALLQGMGRFPVAGLAWFSDDWMAPRFTPVFHLHEGLDIFADFGTPVRATDRGVVTRLSNGAVGGLAVWTRGRDGTEYYFAHLQGYANGIQEGMHVEVGTVLGFVGDTGNARGGTPHLHLEIHRGGRPIPPKPIVDQWLAEAELGAAAWVEARIQQVLAERRLLRSEYTLSDLLIADSVQPSATPEYSILLTLLDPVGGSIGLLPGLPLTPARTRTTSEPLVRELIRQRVGGTVLTSFVTGGSPTADAGG